MPALVLTLALLQAPQPDSLPAVVASRRSSAQTVRVTAYAGYSLALVCFGWALGEWVALNENASRSPLGGMVYRAPVPLEVMAVSGLVFLAVATVLHVAARMMDNTTDVLEEELEADELKRRFRSLPSAQESE